MKTPSTLSMCGDIGKDFFKDMLGYPAQYRRVREKRKIHANRLKLDEEYELASDVRKYEILHLTEKDDDRLLEILRDELRELEKKEARLENRGRD